MGSCLCLTVEDVTTNKVRGLIGIKEVLDMYIVLMGVQGAGKGEQAQFMAEEYKVPHISTGDLFRNMRERTDPLAIEIQEIMNSGKFVSDDTTNTVLLDRLQQQDALQGALFDGYPRNLGQAQWLDRYLATINSSITAVILMELDLYTAFKRTFGRVSLSSQKKTYNIYYNKEDISWEFVASPDSLFPPRLEAKHDQTGEVLKRRNDDAHAGSIIERIDTYVSQTKPLIEYYSRKGLVHRIDASQSIDDVRLSIMLAIEEAQSKKN